MAIHIVFHLCARWVEYPPTHGYRFSSSTFAFGLAPVLNAIIILFLFISSVHRAATTDHCSSSHQTLTTNTINNNRLVADKQFKSHQLTGWVETDLCHERPITIAFNCQNLKLESEFLSALSPRIPHLSNISLPRHYAFDWASFFHHLSTDAMFSGSSNQVPVANRNSRFSMLIVSSTWYPPNDEPNTPAFSPHYPYT